MGNAHSGNTNAHNIIGGNVTFSSAPGAGSTVANATGKRLKIFYHKKEIKLKDLLAKEGSKTTKRFITSNEEMSCFDLSPNEHMVGPSVEEGFASVLITEPADSEVYVETIALNFPVPNSACCIVTAKNEIKFRHGGDGGDGGVWIDEDGHDHCTK